MPQICKSACQGSARNTLFLCPLPNPPSTLYGIRFLVWLVAVSAMASPPNPHSAPPLLKSFAQSSPCPPPGARGGGVWEKPCNPPPPANNPPVGICLFVTLLPTLLCASKIQQPFRKKISPPSPALCFRLLLRQPHTADLFVTAASPRARPGTASF